MLLCPRPTAEDFNILGGMRMQNVVHLPELELIAAVQERNCNEAFAELIKRYSRAIYTWTRPFFNDRVIDREDLLQEARFAFLAAVRVYNPSLSSLFTFAQLCVSRKLCSVARSHGRLKNMPPAPVIPLSGSAGWWDSDDRSLIESVADSDAVDPVEEAIACDSARRIISIASCALSSLEFEVFKGLAAGDSYRELATEMGVEPKTVDNAAFRARRKLRDLMAQELERDVTA